MKVFVLLLLSGLTVFTVQAESVGSVYVPMDSWVYPALDRLAAMGLVSSQISGLRPWTRSECERQVKEAESHSGLAAEAEALLDALRREFDEPAKGLALDSLYTKTGFIAGPMLNDSFHLGQTWTGDSGEPFGRGLNSYDGFRVHYEKGRFFVLATGEFQHAAADAPLSPSLRQEFGVMDSVPASAFHSQGEVDRFQALDAYAGVKLGNFAISAGQQTLWWGPSYDAPLSFSSNAEPTKNARISTVNPFVLPSFLRHLGQIRGEFVMGRLGGQHYTSGSWFNAQKLSFKLTQNLEMGFTRWSILWGEGHPETLGSLLRNFASFNSPIGPAGLQRNDPGDRKAGFDFRYRVPGLRNWLTLYSDSYSDDDPSPLASPRRAAISPGIYLTRVPGLRHVDFRVEAPSTELMGIDQGGQMNYYNNQYRSGNTNYGYLLGNPVGRDGRAIEGWTTYWFSARNKIQFGYRQDKTSAKLLPGGGTQTDGMIKGSLLLPHNFNGSLMVQEERYWIPLIGGPQNNLSAWAELSWEPKR